MAPKDLVGAIVELFVSRGRERLRVLMQVVEQIEDPGAKGLHRVAVFAAGCDATRLRRAQILFVVCFAVRLHLRYGHARVLGHARIPRLARELAPRELWNMAAIGTAVERGWKAGDDYDRLFD